MAEIIKMPKLSDTMTDGTVAAWHKKVGDKVKSGDLLAEIETDKATMEFESFQDGYLLYIGVEKGKNAPVDSILAILGEKGEDYKSILEAEKNKAPKPEAVKEEPKTAKKEEKKGEEKTESISAKQVKTEPVKETTRVAEPVSSGNNGRLKASPLAKKLADDKGIDIKSIKGSGDFGRIIKRDIENF